MLKLVLPVVLTYLGIMSMGFVDLLFVGRVNASAIGAVGVGTSLFSWFLMFTLGMVSGMDHLVSHSHGAEDFRKSRRYLMQGLLLSIGISIPLTAVLVFVSLKLEWLGVNPEILPAAKKYSTVLAFSLVPVSIFNALRLYLTALGQPRHGMVMLFWGNLLNAGLDYGLVLGRWGFPRLEAPGSAWATLIARIFMMIGLIWVLIRHGHKGDSKRSKEDLLFPLKYDPIFMRPLVRLGLPSALQMLFEVGVFALATGLAARFSSAELAAHQIVLNLAGTTFMVPLGIGSAGAVLVGQALGRGQIGKVLPLVRKCFQIGVGFMVFSALLMLVFPDFVLRIFSEDPSVISVGKQILIIAAFFQLFDGIQTVGTGVLRGMGETHTAMVINLVGHWLIGLPVGILLCFWVGWGVVGLWVGLSLGLTAVTVGVLARWIILRKQILLKGGLMK
jgi:MATE family multidrug resistance protein